METIEAVGFDLGETLLFYQDTPMNWAALYEQALAAVASACHLAPSPHEIAAACEILREHNTRLVPREGEVSSDLIISAVLTAWQVPVLDGLLPVATHSFFGFFQQRLCVYPDTRHVLTKLRERRVPVGVLTDVPYGMPATFVHNDLRQVGIEDVVDVLLTSVEVGWRKPAAAGFVALAEQLRTPTGRMLFVGNEAKDVRGAVQAGARGVSLDHERRATDYGQSDTIHSLTEVLTLLK